MPCGFTLEETRRETTRHTGEIERLGGRVHLVDASAYFSRSGPRVVDGLEILEQAMQ
jgi:iron complex transport system substrate-binding protein